MKMIILIDEDVISLTCLLIVHIYITNDITHWINEYYGTKIQPTLTLTNRVNCNYSLVSKEVELSFTDHTMTMTFHLTNSLMALPFTNLHDIYSDLICVLIMVNPVIEKGVTKRQKIVVTNEL
ncbi:hypothetical protein H5410_020967 [Solanum commersonii]|uniref:Uncharacterized protein n=1 Tax=Solanum commersonii TaxID=4109 RepID=A0A9J5ZFS2_SOLCO|nr:hypothetical protein H5410_020967 [Solanum commersonii]